MNEENYKSALNDLRCAQGGDADAMERLVLAHDALVRFVVKKFMDRGKEYEDLYQLGRLGLVRAILNFDEGFGVRFSTYAVPMIMGEIRRYLRDDGQMRVSRTIRENARKALECVRHMREENEKLPQIQEICDHTGLSREDVVLALGALKPVRSLSEPVDAEGDMRVEDTVGDNPFESVEKNLLVQNLLDSLNEKERKLIVLRYFERMTQSRVARELGLTQVQVSRLEKKLLLRMRKDAV